MVKPKFTPGMWTLYLSPKQAKLMTAAPELYEALQKIIVAANGDFETFTEQIAQIQEIARAALAKAVRP